MVKARVPKIFLCGSCGHRSTKWAGQCAECGEWNTISEQPEVFHAAKGVEGRAPIARKLSEVRASSGARFATGISELDRVIGGGIVPGSIILLGGEPGIGKSTLALQALAQLSETLSTLYISGEESLEQLALRFQRMKSSGQNLHALSTGELSAALSVIEQTDARLVVIDSIQMMHTDEFDSMAGSVSQIRACAEALADLAKRKSIALMIIGHVTKDGSLAGPKALEHLVDTVLYFEGDASSRYRLVRAWKNRFGAVNEIGVFAMTETGLREVKNPSAMFLSGGSEDAVGRAVLASQDGSRPLLVEVQALVDQSTLANPRRLSVGYDNTRLAMILAILHRHASLDVVDKDVFVNVAGGVRVAETAADLAVAAAVISSYFDKPSAARTVLFGELGLSGEVRPVARGEERVREAQKLGFDQVFLSPANKIKPAKKPSGAAGIKLVEVSNARELRTLLTNQ